MSEIEAQLNAFEERMKQVIQEAVEETISRLLAKSKPEILTTEDAAAHFGVHKVTLGRWRSEQNWIEGCHWWKQGQTVYYNIPLITDGQINGFQSPQHTKAVQQFRQSLPSQKR